MRLSKTFESLSIQIFCPTPQSLLAQYTIFFLTREGRGGCRHSAARLLRKLACESIQFFRLWFLVSPAEKNRLRNRAEKKKTFLRSCSQTLCFGGREATTGNTSTVRWLCESKRKAGIFYQVSSYSQSAVAASLGFFRAALNESAEFVRLFFISELSFLIKEKIRSKMLKMDSGIRKHRKMSVKKKSVV